jgi:hypothetical protein
MAHVFHEFPVSVGSPQRLCPHLTQLTPPGEASVVTVGGRSTSLNILLAIDSVFILLDVQDTLRDLGYSAFHGTCSAVQARAVLRLQRFDVAILSLDSSCSELDLLLKELDEFDVPTLLIAGGVVDPRSPALRCMEAIRAPFDSTALASAIERVAQDRTRRPDER